MTNTQPTVLHPDRIQPLSDHQLLALTFDLNPSRIESKQGMSYLAQQDVRATLAMLFGFGGFSYSITHQEMLKSEQVQQKSDTNKTNWSVTWKTTLRLEIPQLGCFYEESALGNNKQPDYMEASDMALKTSASDAMKRCAINLGTQFGLSLYNSGATQSIVSKSFAPDNLWPRPDQQTLALKQMIEKTPATDDAMAEAEKMYPEPSEGVTPAQHRANLALVARGIQHRWNLEAAVKPDTAAVES